MSQSTTSSPVADLGEFRRRIPVLVLEQHELTLLGLRALLGSRQWVSRCFAASDPQVALAIARRHQPALILVNQACGSGAGMRLAASLRRIVPFARIVLLSASGRLDRRAAEEYGIDAALLTTAPAASVVELCTSLLDGKLPSNHGLGRSDIGYALSPRETEVLEKLSQGFTNPEIAGMLHLAHDTVKQHTSAVYRKLGVRNRTQAASLAREHGLVA